MELDVGLWQKRTVPFLALLAAVIATLLIHRPQKASPRARALWTAGAIAVPMFAASALAALWYFHRPQPEPHREKLFKGIAYEREVRTSPRPIVDYVVTIDLRTPGISFLVTPLEPGGDGVMRASTTEEFLTRHHVQLAINGDFFLPWWSDGPHDYYPHDGQPSDVLGAAVSGKDTYGWHVTPYSSLVFGHDGSVSIVEITQPGGAPPPAKMVVSGKQIIVDGGKVTAACNASDQSKVTHPRTAAALDRSGKTLLLFAIDGRQPGYSEGVTLEELARIVLEHGGYRAMNMDGGGSTSLVIEDQGGQPRALNQPFHTRIPQRQRPVPNHLGVFAPRLDAP